MSNRFHSKYHRNNHHSLATPGDRDSSHDPVGSYEEPFLGSFVIQASSQINAISARGDVLIQGGVSVGESPENHLQGVTNTSIGAGNTAIGGLHNLTVGTNNSVIDGNNSVYIGTLNSGVSSDLSLVQGISNRIYGDVNVIGGAENIVYSDCNTVFGKSNIVTLSSVDSAQSQGDFFVREYSGGTRSSINPATDLYVLDIRPYESTLSVFVSAYTTTNELITASLGLHPVPAGVTQIDTTDFRALSTAQFLSGSQQVDSYWAYTTGVTAASGIFGTPGAGIFGLLDLKTGNSYIYTSGIALTSYNIDSPLLSSIPPEITISYTYAARNDKAFNIGIGNRSSDYETFNIGTYNELSASESVQIGYSNTIQSLTGENRLRNTNIGTSNSIISEDVFTNFSDIATISVSFIVWS